MTSTVFYSLEEISKNNGKNGNKVWIIYRNLVYDVTNYCEEHPGGGDLITEYAGKDCTKAFDDFGHSGDAKSQLKQFKIGELAEEDRNKKPTKKVVDNGQPKDINIARRSCCNIITCGLMG